MKILLTVEFFWPQLGGAEEVTRHLAEGLASRGHDVHVATSRDPRRRGVALDGVTVHEFAIRGNEVKGLRGEVERYREFLRRFECDVLLNYAAQSWTTDVAFQELGRLAAHHTVLATCGFSGLSTPVRRFVYQRYFQRMPDRMRSYDLVIYHSATFRDAEFGRRNGIRNSVVIPNGVSTSEFAVDAGVMRSRLGVGERPLVVNVSNHYRLKGHDRFIRLAAAVPDAVFLLVGNDPAPRWQSCARRCRRAARTGAIISMAGDRESVTFALRDADLLAFTSRSEVAPLVPLEASAAGVPWVSFDVGNVSELEGGMVVQDEAGFVAAVRKLLWNHDARVRLADEGRRFVSELDWDTIVGRYELELQRLRLQERRIEDAATHRS